MIIKESNDDATYGKILKIFRNSDVFDAFLTISWYYKPSEIFEQVPDYISEAELFDSDLQQNISVQCIYDKANILSFHEYHALDEVDDEVFFFRGFYYHKTKKIVPPMHEWQTTCYCNTIINPDLVYVTCDFCQNMFHVGCTNYILESEANWFCDFCAGS